MQLSVSAIPRVCTAISTQDVAAARGAALTRVFKPGTEIVSPGEQTAALYQITHGWAFCATILADGRRQILNFLLAGDLLPLECIFQSTVQRTYQALTEVTAVGLSLDRFRAVIEQDGAFASAILRQQAKQTQAVSEHLVNAGRRSAYQRVIHLLLELWYRLATANEPEDDTFEVPLTQEIIADALGLSIIHVNRTLQRIRADGLFEIHAGAPMHVRVKKPAAAMQTAGFVAEYLCAV